MHPPPSHPFLFGGGSDSKSGGLTGSQFLEWFAGKEGVDFFRGECSFSIKNKLKSEIFNNKKSFKQKCFSVITKNRRIQTEILTKNLVTFKRWDGVKDEKF